MLRIGLFLRLLPIGLLAVSLLLVFAPHSSSAAGWPPPSRVSLDLNGAVPSMALDSSGNPHIVFQTWEDTDNMVYYAERSGGAWSPLVNLSAGLAADNNEPEIGLDSSGNPHVIWESGGGVYFSERNGGTWSPPLNVCQGNVGAFYSAMSLDASGNPHIVWSASDGSTTRVYFTENTGGGWPLIPAMVSTGGIQNNYYPQIAAEADGSSHVVWIAVSGSAYQVFHASNEGGSWSGPRNLSDNSLNVYDARLALDSGGDPHVIWDGYLGSVLSIVYSERSTGTWSVPVAVSNGSVSSMNPRMALDSSGNPHAVWSGASGTVYYSQRTAGPSWSVPVTLNAGVAGDYLYPTLALDSTGNPHAVWSDQDGSVKRIYYSENTGAGWASPISISPAPLSNNQAPEILLGPGDTPHVAWAGFLGQDGIYNGTYYSARDVTSVDITAFAGTGGSITPSGTVAVGYGTSQTFAVTPDTGYHVTDVVADGVSQGAVTSYTFDDVTAAHTIEASFAIDTFDITATAGDHGSITPSGTVTLGYGASQAFAVVPDTGYRVADVVVDGVSQGPSPPTPSTTSPRPTPSRPLSRWRGTPGTWPRAPPTGAWRPGCWCRTQRMHPSPWTSP